MAKTSETQATHGRSGRQATRRAEATRTDGVRGLVAAMQQPVARTSFSRSTRRGTR